MSMEAPLEERMGSKEEEEDSSSEEEVPEVSEEDMKLMSSLQAELEANPLQYDKHLQRLTLRLDDFRHCASKYIALLKKWGLVETLQAARESMHEWFPLSPSIWKEWICECQEMGMELGYVHALYKRAMQDYLSVDLWEDHLKFLKENLNEFERDEVRSTYESGITCTGMHLSEGDRVWMAAIEIEMAYTSASVDAKTKEQCRQNTRRLFKRAFSVPLYGAEAIQEQYKKWEASAEKDLLRESELVRDTARNARSKREQYENTIISRQNDANETLLGDYFAYIQAEQKLGDDPARIQMLYERAITVFPVTAELWSSYLRYIQSSLRLPDVALSICKRSVRNCPWVSYLWSTSIRVLDSASASANAREEFWELFTKIYPHIAPFLGGTELQEILLARCDSCRQHNGEHELLRQTFQEAAALMEERYPTFVDRTFLLHSYWADCEAACMEDVDAGRAVWESLVTERHKSCYEAWKGFIDYEIRFGSVERCRALYVRSYHRKMDDALHRYSLSHSWLRFEREKGTANTYFKALKKVEEYSSRIEEYLAKQGQAKLEGSSNVGNKRRQVQENRAVIEKKAKSYEQDEVMVEKTPGYSDACTVFVTNLAFSATEADVREKFASCGEVQDVRIIKSSYTGKPKGYAYVDFSDEASVHEATKLAGSDLLGRTINVQKSVPPDQRKSRSRSGMMQGRKPGGSSGYSQKDSHLKKLGSHPKRDSFLQRKPLDFLPRALRGGPSSTPRPSSLSSPDDQKHRDVPMEDS